MALSESQLEARILALKAARDTGALIVRHGDTSTQFRSLAEMESILASLEAELAGVQGMAPKKRVNYIRQDGKGY